MTPPISAFAKTAFSLINSPLAVMGRQQKPGLPDEPESRRQDPDFHRGEGRATALNADHLNPRSPDNRMVPAGRLLDRGSVIF